MKKYIITEQQFKRIVSENPQLADKEYFNSGKLPAKARDFIMNITNGDQTTKVMADFYWDIKDSYIIGDYLKKFPQIHKELLEYNKNVFPIVGFDFYTNTATIFAFLERSKILKDLQKLPKIAIRNLKNDIRTARSWKELEQYSSDLDYLLTQLSQLDNRPEELKNKFYKKIFKSNTTLSDMLDMVEDKNDLLGGFKFTKKNLYELVEENQDDMTIVFTQGTVMVIRIESAEAIKRIGCNSLWCFTYGQASSFYGSASNWNKYSTNGVVYITIDLSQSSDSPYFMLVLIKPLITDQDEIEDGDNEINDGKLFNMGNDNIEQDGDNEGASIELLSSLVGFENIDDIYNFQM